MGEKSIENEPCIIELDNNERDCAGTRGLEYAARMMLIVWSGIIINPSFFYLHKLLKVLI